MLVTIGSLLEVVVVAGACLVVGSVCGCFCWISGASGRVSSYVLYSSGVLWRSFLFRRNTLPSSVLTL